MLTRERYFRITAIIQRVLPTRLFNQVNRAVLTGFEAIFLSLGSTFVVFAITTGEVGEAMTGGTTPGGGSTSEGFAAGAGGAGFLMTWSWTLK